jgi:hypothetical protein
MTDKTLIERARNCGALVIGPTAQFTDLELSAFLASETAELRAKLEVAEEALKPKPLPEGLVPHAYQLAATIQNADYWYQWGHKALDTGTAVMCMEQSMFAWKNAALAKSEDLMKAEATIEALQLRVARLVDAIELCGHSYSCATRDGNAPDDEPCNCGKAAALSSEGDSQWLREKQAEATATSSEKAAAFDAVVKMLTGNHKETKFGKSRFEPLADGSGLREIRIRTYQWVIEMCDSTDIETGLLKLVAPNASELRQPAESDKE